MMYSRHYTEDRVARDRLISLIGEGTVVYTTVQYDIKRHRNYLYEITDNAILIVKAADVKNLVITKMIARPARLKAYWADVPEYILIKAIEHTKKGMQF